MINFFVSALHAATLGFMLCFLIIVAPNVHRILTPENAGALLRKLFPSIFIFGLTMVAVAAILAMLEGQTLVGGLSTASALGFAVNAFIIAPTINGHRDAVSAGDTSRSSKFRATHSLSVIIYLAQIIVSFACLFLLFRN